ncbi:hypothetical protein [Arcanobacterium phocae]|uniref:hypothetical protein n=1 Tax=Arcanobacterium phocae TaxID=131112 RepID=UPI001C0EEE6B|nr:hypothetical protein [Arcanobacterium phocae]
MKRILGMIALIAGVAMIVGTFVVSMAQQKEVNVKLSTADDSAVFVKTAPGVLTLVNDKVKVNLDAPGQEIQWGLGSSADVDAFAGQAASLTVTGLSSWKALAVETDAGSDEGAQIVKEAVDAEKFTLTGSDMWTKDGQAKDHIKIMLDARQIDGKTLIATTSAGKAPRITLEWVRARDSGNPAFFYVVGALIALIGSFLLLNWYQEELARRQRIKKPSVKLRSRAHVDRMPSVMASFDGNLADPETERDIQRLHTGSALGASILPGTSHSELFRSRELDPKDRILLTAQAAEDLQALTPETKMEDNVTEEPAEVESLQDSPNGQNSKDWRSLWNFSWGPQGKEEHDA